MKHLSYCSVNSFAQSDTRRERVLPYHPAGRRVARPSGRYFTGETLDIFLCSGTINAQRRSWSWRLSCRGPLHGVKTSKASSPLKTASSSWALFEKKGTARWEPERDSAGESNAWSRRPQPQQL